MLIDELDISVIIENQGSDKKQCILFHIGMPMLLLLLLLLQLSEKQI